MPSCGIAEFGESCTGISVNTVNSSGTFSYITPVCFELSFDFDETNIMIEDDFIDDSVVDVE